MKLGLLSSFVAITAAAAVDLSAVTDRSMETFNIPADARPVVQFAVENLGSNMLPAHPEPLSADMMLFAILNVVSRNYSAPSDNDIQLGIREIKRLLTEHGASPTKMIDDKHRPIDLISNGFIKNHTFTLLQTLLASIASESDCFGWNPFDNTITFLIPFNGWLEYINALELSKCPKRTDPNFALRLMTFGCSDDHLLQRVMAQASNETIATVAAVPGLSASHTNILKGIYKGGDDQFAAVMDRRENIRVCLAEINTLLKADSKRLIDKTWSANDVFAQLKDMYYPPECADDVLKLALETSKNNFYNDFMIPLFKSDKLINAYCSWSDRNALTYLQQVLDYNPNKLAHAIKSFPALKTLSLFTREVEDTNPIGVRLLKEQYNVSVDRALFDGSWLAFFSFHYWRMFLDAYGIWNVNGANHIFASYLKLIAEGSSLSMYTIKMANESIAGYTYDPARIAIPLGTPHNPAEVAKYLFGIEGMVDDAFVPPVIKDSVPFGYIIGLTAPTPPSLDNHASNTTRQSNTGSIASPLYALAAMALVVLAM